MGKAPTPIFADETKGPYQSIPQLVFGYIDFWPYNYSENGKATGVLIDIKRLTMDLLPYKYTLTHFPIGRLYHSLKHGTIHVWAGAATTHTADQHTYVGTVPIFTPKINIYSWDAPLPINPGDITEPVIAILGYKYAGLRYELENAAQPVKFIEATSHETAFKMLIAGRARYLLNYSMPSSQIIKRLGADYIESITVRDAPIVFHVSKKVPNAVQLLAEIEATFLTLKNLPTPPE